MTTPTEPLTRLTDEDTASFERVLSLADMPGICAIRTALDGVPCVALAMAWDVGGGSTDVIIEPLAILVDAAIMARLQDPR